MGWGYVSDTLFGLGYVSDTLFGLLVGEKSAMRRQALRDFETPVSVENEVRAWSFLEARAQLLLKAYGARPTR